MSGCTTPNDNISINLKIDDPWQSDFYPIFQFRCSFGPEGLPNAGIIYINPLPKGKITDEGSYLYRYIIQVGNRIVHTNKLGITYSLDVKKTAQIIINGTFDSSDRKKEPWLAQNPQFRPLKSEQEDDWQNL